IEQRGIRKIALPDFNCDVVEAVCRAHALEIRFYPVGADLRPKTLQTEEDEWLYLVNFYGQLSPDELQRIAARVPRLIVDNAQAYFDLPLKGVDTLYTCRKFLGVPDGGFLYTEAPEKTLPADESRERMGFVLGRFERPAGEYFAAAAQNNDDLSMEPKSMSELTKNLLHAVDYDRVKTKRTENFRLLHEGLGSVNCLNLRETEGAYAYPLMLPEGQKIRKKLIERKIFVPMLWPNVPEQQPADSEACRLAVQILPLPCDQRYGAEEMAFIIKAVRDCLNP
ncbi:MAG: hypothetical protein II581_06115, partial [Oscillospiraceae bacterium]|nr:hypothetical protein [Oscillospiraceae bacterium]